VLTVVVLGIFLASYLPARFEVSAKARALVAKLENLPPGDMSGFQSYRTAKLEFLRSNPSWESEFLKPEQTWAEATTTKLKDELQALAPDAVAQFQKGAAQRRAFAEAFPAYKEEMETAARAWGKTSFQAAEAELAGLAALDIAGFQKGTPHRLKLGKLFPECRVALTKAELAWAERSVQACEAELKTMPLKDEGAFTLKAEQRQFVAKLAPELKTRLKNAELAWGERSVTALVKALDALAAGDVVGYGSVVAPAEFLTQTFPALQGSLETACQGWAERTLAKLKKDVSSVGAGDGESFLKVHGLAQEFTKLFPAKAPSVAEVEAGWCQRTVAAALKQAEPLRKTEPLKASAQLQLTAKLLTEVGFGPGAQAPLTAARQAVFKESLEFAKVHAKAKWKEDGIGAATKVAEQLGKEMQAEAQAVGQATVLEQFVNSYRFLNALDQPPKKK
jgi:hypothetical protein